jgi:DNA-binding MarR family transcriptional regulator
VRSVLVLDAIADPFYAGGSVGPIAEYLGIPVPSVTRHCDALVEYDLVRRDQDPTDRRKVRLYATDKGLHWLGLKGTP